MRFSSFHNFQGFFKLLMIGQCALQEEMQWMMTWVCWISLWNTKWHRVALMVLVVTFPLFCRKLLLSLVDFFINQVPVERHTRFIAYSIPPLPWLLFWHKVVICTQQNTYFALHFSYNWVAAEKIQRRFTFKLQQCRWRDQTENYAARVNHYWWQPQMKL